MAVFVHVPSVCSTVLVVVPLQVGVPFRMWISRRSAWASSRRPAVSTLEASKPVWALKSPMIATWPRWRKSSKPSSNSFHAFCVFWCLCCGESSKLPRRWGRSAVLQPDSRPHKSQRELNYASVLYLQTSQFPQTDGCWVCAQLLGSTSTVCLTGGRGTCVTPQCQQNPHHVDS